MTKARFFLLIGLLLAAVAGIVVLVTRTKASVAPATVADLSVVHPGVKVEDVERRGLTRLSVGAHVTTDADGRGRLRLDDGSVALLDRGTNVVVSVNEIALDSGRLFLIGAPGAQTKVKLGDAVVRAGGSNVGLERKDGHARAYAANEEIVVEAGGTEHKVRSGESATIDGASVTVAAEKAFADWTGGLAAPWGAGGLPHRAVGELWGREFDSKPGDAGSPLTVRSHDVEATLYPEIAVTKVRTTYFNGGSRPVQGDFRMAIPVSAIVSSFAMGTGDKLETGTIALASRDEKTLVPSAALLEWAGDGWVRGHLPSIDSGAAVSVEIEYVEWLSVSQSDGGKLMAEYRYPLAGEGDPPLIGEFSAKIDTSAAHPRSIAAGSGASVDGTVVRTRKPDFRPTADLVVDVALPSWDAGARVYMAKPEEGEEQSTILVRADLPQAGPDAGATLALVVDTSGSSEPADLEVSRGFVRALLDTMGQRDRVIVLAADQRVRPIGPGEIGPLDDARRSAILDALGKITPGGATDLGRAFEAAADALPADTPGGIVVYVGDGWPTMGDPDVKSIDARLARRSGGKPRLGAIAIGPLAHARALSALTRGSGPLYSVVDGSDASAVATALVSEALRPAFSNVEIVLGPGVEQVYPRSAHSALAGNTVEAVGRVRGSTPYQVTLRWTDKSGPHEEMRMVSKIPAPRPDDLRRRWADARVNDVVLAGRGRETATDVALRAGLLTPWTGLLVNGGKSYVGSVLECRQLDVAVGDVDSMFDPGTAFGGGTEHALGALVSVPFTGGVDATGDDRALEQAVREAAERLINVGLPSLRACRDSRAALRPDLGGNLNVVLSVDGDGGAHDVRVHGTTPQAEDAALDRCMEVALGGMVYPASGLTTKIRVERELPIPVTKRVLGGARCSALSGLPLPLRRGVWRARLDSEKPIDVYVAAKQSCELNDWQSRRALLELALLVVRDGSARVSVASDLDLAGETEAAAFMRREAVRRATTAAELGAVKTQLLGEENYPRGAFNRRYKAAHDDGERLALVRRFLGIAPHDGFLRSRLVALLESLGKKEELREEARRVRLDPFAPAELLADMASALRRIGDEDDARRTFGELAERAPADPWARAFLGDRLRNEGWFDDAVATYSALDELSPADPAATIRLALAHAGAGRLDIARRLLTRVVETGGRLGNPQAGELAGHVASSLLSEARSASGLGKGESEALTFAALEIPRAERRVVVLLRGPAGAPALSAKLVRTQRGQKEEIPVEITAATMGLYALAFEPGDAEVELSVSRPEELSPARPMKIDVDALVPSGDLTRPPSLSRVTLSLPASGKPVSVRWNGSAWAGAGGGGD